MTRRNCLPASAMPAAHQRNAMFPDCQCLTLRAWVRLIEIIDSMLLVERSVRARVGGTPRRSTVSVSVSPSRSDAAAPGWVPVQLTGEGLELGLGGQRGLGVVGLSHPLGHGGGEVVGQPVSDIA